MSMSDGNSDLDTEMMVDKESNSGSVNSGGGTAAGLKSPPPTAAEKKEESSSSDSSAALLLAQLQTVIEQVPLPEKAAYLQALEKCPHLVESESNPISFLRVEDFNTWEAAQRLVGYWETRLQVFGPERAYLPMNLTGHGALDDEAIRAVQTGYNLFLPNDVHGRPVVCLDSNLASNDGMDEQFSQDAILRSSYYVRNVIALHPLAQTEGYVGLVIFSAAFGTMSKSPAFQRLTDCMRVFPLRVRAIYILKIIIPPQKKQAAGGADESSQPLSLKSTVRTGAQVLDENVGHRLNPIVAQSNAELLRKLEVYGLNASALPTSVGGTFDSSTFFTWLETQALPTARSATGYPMMDRNNTGRTTTTSSLDSKPAAVDMNNRAANNTAPPPPQTQVVPQVKRQGSDSMEPDEVTGARDAVEELVDVDQEELTLMTLEAFDYMDDFEKAAYCEAMEKCPTLVAEESCPSRFLECEGLDPWAAARRLASYWAHRKKIFGPQRAFLPMDQTGSGALTADDVRLVQCGFNIILPQTAATAAAGAPADVNHDKDTDKQEDQQSQGRSVLLVDRSKIPDDASPMALLRAVFYALQVVSENEASQQQGYVCLVLDSHASHCKPLCAAVVQDGNDLFETAMPIRSADIHILCPLWMSEEQQQQQEQSVAAKTTTAASPTKASGWMDMVVQQRPTVHVSRTPQDLVAALESLGLHQEHLPAELGGACTESDMATWHDDRIKIEKERNNGSSSSAQLKEEEPDEHPNEQEAMAKIQRAIDRIPESQKADYMLAQEQVPDLVAHETPRMRFLQNDDFDASAAASRLVAYWANRRSLFAEKAFLPMNLTGDGALSDKEVELLKSGFIVSLASDSQERSVLFVNKRRMERTTEPSSVQLQCRVFFYWMHVIAENPLSQNDGFVLYLLWGPPFNLQATYKYEMELLAEAIPARLSAHRVLCLSQDLPSVFPRLIHSLKSSIVEKTFVHVGETRNELCDGLRRLGFPTDGIPADVGGDWEYEGQLPNWLDDRKKTELVYQKEFSTVHANTKHLLTMCADRLQSIQSRHTLVARIERAEFRKKSLAVLDDVINLLPDETKAPYLEAMERIPRLCAKESDSVQFLRAEDYDPWAAARLLTAYWQKRKQIFKERAFLPMNQSGEGSLAKSDISLLTTGYCCLLPDDTKGRPVLCIDESRRKNARVDNRARVGFYLASVMAENELAQEEGCVVFVILNKKPTDASVEPLFEIAETALPLSIAEIHVMLTPSCKVDVNTLTPWVLKKYGKQATLHTGNSEEELAAKLVSSGFEKDSIPAAMGGTWSYAQFAQWIEIRTRLEWELPLGLAQKSAGGSGSSRPRIRSMAELTEEEKTERKRRMNLLHSRRKREKARVEIDVLKKQVAELQDSNKTVSEDNTRLELLLRESNSMVARRQMEQQPNRPTQSSPATQPAFSVRASAQAVDQMDVEHAPERRNVPSNGVDGQQQQSIEQQLQQQQLLLQMQALNGSGTTAGQQQHYNHQTNPGLVGRANNNQSSLLQMYSDIPDNNTSPFPPAPPMSGLALAGISQLPWSNMNDPSLSEQRSSTQQQQAGGALGLALQQQLILQQQQQQQQQQRTNSALGGLTNEDALSLLQHHLLNPSGVSGFNGQQQQQQQQQHTAADRLALELAIQQLQQQAQQQQQQQPSPQDFPSSTVGGVSATGLQAASGASSAPSSSSSSELLQYLASQQQHRQRQQYPPPPS